MNELPLWHDDQHREFSQRRLKEAESRRITGTILSIERIKHPTHGFPLYKLNIKISNPGLYPEIVTDSVLPCHVTPATYFSLPFATDREVTIQFGQEQNNPEFLKLLSPEMKQQTGHVYGELVPSLPHLLVGNILVHIAQITLL